MHQNSFSSICPSNPHTAEERFFSHPSPQVSFTWFCLYVREACSDARFVSGFFILALCLLEPSTLPWKAYLFSSLCNILIHTKFILGLSIRKSWFHENRDCSLLQFQYSEYPEQCLVESGCCRVQLTTGFGGPVVSGALALGLKP